MGLKLLVIGGGGREHCLAWALARSSQVEQVYVTPGNGGTATEPKCCNLTLDPLDFAGLICFARQAAIDLTIAGPEAPLAEGIADAFQAAGLLLFGPTRAGARIEASKAWAKKLMHRAGVPTAACRVFTDIEQARGYVRDTPVPLVVKADGLAQGKGVTVAMDTDTALDALDQLIRLGECGRTVVIEEYLSGEEASVLAFTDGRTILPMLAAQDHKRIGVGDTGPNTGGMGAYAPAPLVTPEVMSRIEREVLAPTVDTLAREGIDYRGVLYAGLMIDREGTPRVIEFNCRLGDPETQVLLPLLETPLEEVLLSTVHRQLEQVHLQWRPGACACVVVSAAGYPGPYRQGDLITGLDRARETGALIFQAGTRQVDGKLLSGGGRVLGVSALGTGLAEALALAYSAVGEVDFTGAYHRPDIGWQALSQAK